MNSYANSPTLTARDGSQLQLTITGDAVYRANATGLGSVLDLIEAREVWSDMGGSDDEFDAAVSYVDSLR